MLYSIKSVSIYPHNRYKTLIILYNTHTLQHSYFTTMFQLTHCIMIVTVVFMWTAMSLCACYIIEDLLENIQEMKREIKELKELKKRLTIVDQVHIKTA